MAGTYHLYIWTGKRTRGRRIGSFLSYRALVMEAQFRAQLAGYAKSRWSDLYDWNNTERKRARRG